MGWMPYDDGRTIGTKHASGVIVADERHTDGARITIEDWGNHHEVVWGVFGWAFGTAFFGSRAETNAGYEAIKARLVAILNLIPSADDPDGESKFPAVTHAIAKVTEDFP